MAQKKTLVIMNVVRLNCRLSTTVYTDMFRRLLHPPPSLLRHRLLWTILCLNRLGGFCWVLMLLRLVPSLRCSGGSMVAPPPSRGSLALIVCFSRSGRTRGLGPALGSPCPGGLMLPSILVLLPLPWGRGAYMVGPATKAMPLNGGGVEAACIFGE